MKTVEEKEEDYKSIKKEAKKLFLIFVGFGLVTYLMINGLSVFK
jgi:cytochrome bd-type quinol oxidase subunit 1